MKPNTRHLCSCIFDIFLVVISIVFTFMMAFSAEDAEHLSGAGMSALVFFTVLSNLLVGLTSLIALFLELPVILKKKDIIPVWVTYMKLFSASSVAVTFLVVLFFLAPLNAVMRDGFFGMYTGSNFFFHLINPLLAMTDIIFFSTDYKLKKRYLPIGMLPVVLYGVTYTFNYYLHFYSVQNVYDWYGLYGDGNLARVIVVVILFLILAYGSNLLLWFFNRLSFNKAEKHLNK